MKQLILICYALIASSTLFSQGFYWYNPQTLYELPGGMYDEDSLRTINLTFLNPNYHDTLVDAFFNNPDYRIPATLSMNGQTFDSVGVRYKGNSTFCLPNDNGNPKVPYNIDMNYWKTGQNLNGYKKIKLANAWLDATFCNEVSASNIYRNYLPSPEVNLMKLNVQGNYLGLYVNTESINKQFLEKQFNEKNGTLIKCDNANVFCGPNNPNAYPSNLGWLGTDSSVYYDTYDMKSTSGWGDLMDLINTLNFSPNDLDTILNIDRVLWAFAVNTVIANYDTYNGYYVHNYYLYQTKDGLFQMIPWDLSESFLNALLGFDINPAPGDPLPLEYNPYFGENLLENRPLAYHLLNDPVYRKQYTAHMKTVLSEIDTIAFRNDIDALQSLAFNAAQADNNKMFGMFQYYNNVENDFAWIFWGGFGFAGIMPSLTGRMAYINSLPEINLSAPEIDTVYIQDGYVYAQVQNCDSVQVMATTNKYNSKFKPFHMYDDGTNGDATAADGLYTAPIPLLYKQKTVKFYIRAHNNDAMTLSPARAEYEFYYYIPPDISNNQDTIDYVLIYPNPTTDFITIETSKELPLEYTLSSSIGQKIEHGFVNTNNYQIDMRRLRSEMYLLELDNKVYKILKVD